MKTTNCVRFLPFAFLFLSMAARAADVPTVTVTRTNWAPRYITNVIEVQMPRNIFVDQYHTNQVFVWHTNQVSVYRTNFFTQTITNLHNVPVVRTNFVNHFQTNVLTVPQTNWQTVYLFRTNWTTNLITNFRTNLVDVYQTNWALRLITNVIPISITQTKPVLQYETNLTTITVTNWDRVLVFKTNYVTQPVTNVAEVNIPAEPQRVSPGTNAEPIATNSPLSVLPPPVLTSQFKLDAAAGKTSTDNQLEIILKLRPVSGDLPAFVSYEWHVERFDLSAMFGSRGEEFKRGLTPGEYHVDVTAREANGQGIRVRANIQVTSNAVLVK